MQVPLEISFRNMEASVAVEANVRERAGKLERFAKQITSCRIVVEAPHKHKHKGHLYNVTIDVSLPGEEIIASRHPDKHHAHEDVYVAIRDAFDATQRQLESYAGKRRAKLKVREEIPYEEEIAEV